MIRMIVGLIAAAAALSGAGVPPGYGGGSGRPGNTRLTLSYRAEDGPAAAAKLHCDPAGGSHPAGAAACATLAAAGGDPGRIPAAPTMCMMIYAPVLAEMSGTWRGKSIDWRHSFGNSCEMQRATGVLFTF
jgi:hypothetical protein